MSVDAERYEETPPDESTSTQAQGQWDDTTSTKPHIRHRWEGDRCVKCGAIKPVRQQRNTQPRASVGPKSKELETIAALAWLGAGIGISKQPLFLQARIQLPNGEEGAKICEAIGRTWSAEAGIAGRRIDSALRKNPLVYAVITRFLKSAGPMTEIAPLLIPPLIVGLAAAKPKAFQAAQGVLLPIMAPVMVEIGKYAVEQQQAMQAAEGISEDAVKAAESMLYGMMQKEPEDETASATA